MNRIAIFCDVQSLWYTAKKWCEGRVDYGKLMRAVADGREVRRATAYYQHRPGIESFITAIKHLGYEAVPLTNGQSADQAISKDVESQAQFCSSIAIVAGEGRYTALFRRLRASGKDIELHMFPVPCPMDDIVGEVTKVVSLGRDVLQVQRAANG